MDTDSVCVNSVTEQKRKKNLSLTQIQSRIPSHGSLRRLILYLCPPVQSRSFAFASQLCFDSCLLCVALTKEEPVYEGSRTLNLGMFYVLSSRLALCISDFDPAALQTQCGWFLLWKSDCEKVGWRATAVGCVCVLLLLCVFVALGCSLPILDPTDSESLLTHLFLPCLIFFLFLPTHSSFALLLRK